MTTKLAKKESESSTQVHGNPRGTWGWSRCAALFCAVSILVAGAVSAAAKAPDTGGKKDIKVYQANVYVGALIEAPLALDPNDPNFEIKLLLATTQVYQEILAANPAARMAALAEEIATQRPEIAALQELYKVELAPATAQGPGQFTEVADYLQLLTDALAAKGAHYKVAVVSTEGDTTLPLIASMDPFMIAYGRVIDHEAILVRSDLPPGQLQTSNPQTGRYAFYPEVQVGGQTVSIYRGWCSVDIFTRGERFRVICTHTQDESIPEMQKAELAELLGSVAAVKMPVMIIGDLNTDPLGRNQTDSYPLIPASGFQDTWATLFPQDVAGGLTWGHDSLLADPSTEFSYRIDYILYRGNQFTPTSFQILDPQISATTPPLWPSDHAAVTATFRLGNGR